MVNKKQNRKIVKNLELADHENMLSTDLCSLLRENPLLFLMKHYFDFELVYSALNKTKNEQLNHKPKKLAKWLSN